MTDKQYLRLQGLTRGWYNLDFTEDEFREACLIMIQDKIDPTNFKEFRKICRRLEMRTKTQRYKQNGFNHKTKTKLPMRDVPMEHLNTSEPLLNKFIKDSWFEEQNKILLEEERLLEELRYDNDEESCYWGHDIKW